MTPEQVTLVQESFAKVAPIADQAAAIFYGNLFERDPSLRALFTHDMAEQGKKLMQTLAVVVAGLSKPETVIPAAQQLAVRHVAYGVLPEHYATVGAALLDTLRAGLGDAFTPEVEGAWAAAYGVLSGVMKAAAYPELSPKLA